MGRFESGNRLRTRDRGKGVEKVIKTVASLEIVDQIAKGHAGSHENGNSAENLWIAVNDQGPIRHLRSSRPERSTAATTDRARTRMV